jgi:hypothetical protein
MGMMQMDQEDQNVPARSYSRPQEVEMQHLNASKTRPPFAANMANLKGNRFQHVLERHPTTARQYAKDQKPIAIPDDGDNIHVAKPADVGKPSGDGKGNYGLYRRPIPVEQHAETGMDRKSRAATSRVDASMDEEYVGAYRVNGSKVMEADAGGSVLYYKSFKTSEVYSSNQLRASTQSRSLSAGGGLVAAEAIESEAIVYAEVAHDTSKRNLRLVYLFGCMAIAAILIGTLVPHFLNQQDGDGVFVDP